MSDEHEHHSIAICFGPAATLWGLTFRTKDEADSTYWHITECLANGIPTISVSDEFGNLIFVTTSEVHGVMREDPSRASAAQVARFVQQNKTQIAAQQAAENDPVIKRALAQARFAGQGQPPGFGGMGGPRMLG